MKYFLCCFVLILSAMNVQAQGYYQGTLYLDNEVPVVVIEDQRSNADVIRINVSGLKVYDQDNKRSSIDKLRNGDPVSYKYNSFTQTLEVWVDLVELDRVEE